MKKIILKQTKNDNAVRVDVDSIAAYWKGSGRSTVITLKTDSSFFVEETPEEIDKMIEELEEIDK